ncbi:sensor histidine kinase [Streptomyces sp. NBC_00557]|uniref:sensor histidine kinase n=1 Tax=Streptomyces sp. NBC_00557 TaxID=2975776 RepID=UPI002E7FC908|nr:histidine kinase [Streptomyces sp. NBC_00557]WUC39550.1 histidine kinase [Streptomyces sp. NBC_00557]
MAVALALGTPALARRGSVRLANGLLGAGLPAPLREPPSRLDRLRTAAWLVPHMVLGGVVTAVSFCAMLAAVAFPSVWLGGERHMALFGLSLHVSAGWRGAWSLGLTAVCLAVAPGAALGGAAALRPVASVLLGHGRRERMAAAEERMDLLARRNLLAQELHDSIGHTLTTSTIQAAVAVELMDRDPAGARRALTSIEETSRAAMDDLDLVLGMLRDEEPSRAPRPTLADLGPLVEGLRDTGTELVLEVEGDLGQVPATVSREAYRIVQEGLTNALKHGATRIRLRTAVRGGWWELELTNPLGAQPTERQRSGGQGLRGIQDRVRLLRGEMRAQAEAAHGQTGDAGAPNGTAAMAVWRLTVRLPLGAQS